jgi:hypothetical protein
MREIVEEHKFRQQLDGLGVSHELLDTLLETICLTVAKHPEIFEEVPGKPLRRLRVVPFPGLPKLNVWFRHDDKYVYFLDIDVLERDDKYEI